MPDCNFNLTELAKLALQLEERLSFLEQKLSSNLSQSELRHAKKVTGSVDLLTSFKVRVLPSELVEIYNYIPHFLFNLVISVSLTADSYRQKSKGELFLEKDKNGNYWVIATDDDKYWLFPKVNLKINSLMMTTFAALFKFQNESEAEIEQFILLEPARVSRTYNGNSWKLEEPGELEFCERPPSSELLSELKRSREERQQIWFELKQLSQDFWQLKYFLEQLAKERQQDTQWQQSLQTTLEKLALQAQQANQERQQIQARLEQVVQAQTHSQPQLNVPAPQVEDPPLEATTASGAESSESTPSSTTADRQNPQLLRTLHGHKQLVRTLAISSDSQIIASGSFDNTIKIWNFQTGELIDTIEHHCRVYAIALSPCEPLLVFGSDDNAIGLWNTDLSTMRPGLSGHSDWVRCVAFSPDGQTLVSGSRDATIKIWNWQTGEILRTLSGHSGAILSIAVSPDGCILASGSADHTIKIWNLQTGELLYNLHKHSSLVCTLAIAPNGETLVSGSYDNTIKLWNLRTGELQNSLSEHFEGVWSVAISPDGQTLASSSGGDSIKLWKLPSGKLLCNLTGQSNGVYSLTFSPDGQTLARGGKDRRILIWQLSSVTSSCSEPKS
jgi:WD40 repeat protein